MITLIGTRWKRSNALSQGVLIARLLLGNLEIIPSPPAGGRFQKLKKRLSAVARCAMARHSIRAHCLGGLSRGSHLFPFRTEQLSPVEPMILNFIRESR